jgi:hypothetical protein
MKTELAVFIPTHICSKIMHNTALCGWDTLIILTAVSLIWRLIHIHKILYIAEQLWVLL